MPDEVKKTEGEGEGQKPTAVDEIKEAITAGAKSQAEVFKETLEAVRASAAPAAPVAPAVDPEEERKAAQTRADEALAHYQELCDNGKHAEAAQYLLRVQGDEARRAASTVDETKSAGYKALFAQARREAKRDEPEIFKQYGEEIESEIAAMDAGDRINVDMWDEGIRRVKARHIDDLVAAGIAAKEAESQLTGGARRAPVHTANAPNAGGDEEQGDLLPEQEEARQMLGMTVEEYKDCLKGQEDATIKKGLHRGMYNLVGTDKPQPGAF